MKHQRLLNFAALIAGLACSAWCANSAPVMAAEAPATVAASPDPITMLAPLIQAREQAEDMIIDVSARTKDPTILTPIRNKYVALEGKANGFIKYLALGVSSGHYDPASTQSALQGVVQSADAFEDEAGQIQQQGFFPAGLVKSLGEIIPLFLPSLSKVKPIFDKPQQDRDAYADQITARARWRDWSVVTAQAPAPNPS